ncbi:hypothetical protein LB521_27660 [Mesorhizobium sp. BR-1-1-8]|uniref:hypothetical protein n=1 Tax=Mesorhizobium sp. BR-1-1-8 TaxID=2876659 RepID=UPI001CCE94A7|nr:hypothetical protein [Mesorhizobium sp. BR-1-1-8]MBZ9984914.1 hypothetical protein [Mesorhizobium sp. BR-1-1-8]
MSIFSKPSVDGAIASIVSGISHLEKAIAHQGKRAAAELNNFNAAKEAHEAAVVEISRATRIKAKLEELVA